MLCSKVIPLRSSIAALMSAASVASTAVPAAGVVVLMDPATNNGSFEIPDRNDGDTGPMPGWTHPGGDFNFKTRQPTYLDGATEGFQSLNIVNLAGWESNVLSATPLVAGRTLSLSVDYGWDSWVNQSPAAGQTSYLYAVNPANSNDQVPLLTLSGTPDYHGFGTDAGWKTFSASTIVPAAQNNWYLKVVNASGGTANHLIDNFVITMSDPEPPPLFDRGHQILLNRGLQIQAQVFPRLEDTGQNVGFNLARWEESNFTTANFHWNDQTEQYVGPSPGIAWGRYAWDQLRPQELANLSSLASIQYRDEQSLSNADNLEAARAWLETYRAQYPDALSYTNQSGGQHSVSVLQNYVDVAKPDMVMFDTYPFGGNASGANRSETTFYEYMQKYRQLGLRGHSGHSIPYGLYLQAFVDPSGHTPSDSEMRLNQFAAWAFGYTFVSALEYNQFSTQYPSGGAYGPIYFNGVGDSSPTDRFYIQAEINRQSRNLGPALVRLISTDIRFVPGQYVGAFSQTFNNPTPSGMSVWNDAADPYISGVSATNVAGTVNNGKRGDVLVGYFKPLDASLVDAGHENDIYFMVVNALIDPALNADARQDILLSFDFGSSGFTTLKRLNRLTGEPERVDLVHDSGSLYHLNLTLDGGIGDFFGFGHAGGFIGIQNGDSDLDGDVDLSDLGALASHYGAASGARWSYGDFDLDGDVDLSDLGTLASHYGAGQAQAMADFLTLVPEPHSLSVLFLAIPLARRRR